MNDQIAKYVRKHTVLVSSVIIISFLILGLGEYMLYRTSVHLNQMVSEGLMQIKEEAKKAGDPDSIMMKKGKMMFQKDSQTMMMDQDMDLSDGTKIMMSGQVVKPDGSTWMMKEGEVMKLR